MRQIEVLAPAGSFETMKAAYKAGADAVYMGGPMFGARAYADNADMEQIQQVLYNLLDNAVKFSDDESSIEVETTEKNDRVFISVKDHGCGIPKNSLSRIWDRFYKTDVSRGKDRKGTGLGLSIVKEIFNAHDQNIDVVSTEGIGTEFIFTLEKA